MAGMTAALDVMVEEDVRGLSATRGARLIAGLELLAEHHAWIGEARGMGLMVGLELIEDGPDKVPSPRRAKALLEATRQEGLLVGVGGLYDQVLRLGPNLLFSESEMDEALARLGQACQRVD